MDHVSKAIPYGRSGIRSGALAALGGAATILRGLGSLRRGDTRRALVRLLAGGLFVGVALVQRRSGGSDVDQTDVVSTAPDIDAVDGESGDEAERDDDAVADAADTSVDIEEAGSAPELDSDVDAADVDQTDVVDSGIDENAVDDASVESDEGSAQ